MTINVAIDGPSGAGKSSIARRIAAQLGFIYVDTGALYRTVGLNALRLGVDTKDAAAVAETLKNIKVTLGFADGEQRVFLGEEDVSLAIRTPEASMAASDVSAVGAVREYLFDLQKSIARENNCIMDGRDIGTVVLPEAQVKIFLTASAEDRAMRRHLELIEKGMESDYDAVLADMIKRDWQDSHREIAPLRQAEDAIPVDTTGNTMEQSLTLLSNIIKERIG